MNQSPCLHPQSDNISTLSTTKTIVHTFLFNENWLTRFLEERCEISHSADCYLRKLYNAYKQWATDTGEYLRRERDFSAELKAYACTSNAFTFMNDRHKIYLIG